MSNKSKPLGQWNKKEITDFLKDYFSSLDKAKKKIENFGTTIENLKKKATLSRNAIGAEVGDIKRHAKMQKTSIDDEQRTTKEQAQEAKKIISNELTEIRPSIEEIKKYHGELLVGKTGEGEDNVLSIKAEIEAHFENQKTEFEKLRTNLKDEIRSLLPEAGAAGLSSAYFEAKKRYGTVPYKKNEDEEKAENITDMTIRGGIWYAIKVIWHMIETNLKGVMFYCLFIMPLVMIFGMFSGYWDVFDATIKPNDIAYWITRFFLVTPFIAISVFGLQSIRLNRRLYEEYNHKQRVMQLYHSFDDEIETFGKEEQKQKLIDIMLQNVADKPSLAVHSGKEERKDSSLMQKIIQTSGMAKKDSTE